MKRTLLLVLVILMFGKLYAQYSMEHNASNDAAKDQFIGPEHGKLLIIGGNVGDEIWDEFKDMLGGAEQPLVVIPTAVSSNILDQEFLDNYKKRFHDRGFSNVTVLHTRNRDIANSSSFIAPLKTAAGVWFSGGRQWRHADSYLHTKTHEAFNELLDRGGVIAGTSAGATIQGAYLARGHSENNTRMMGDHEEGLGFFKNVAIDQHLLVRNRQFDMFEILDQRSKLLGIGIDEKNTAIIVHRNQFRVIGESYVAIYDGTRWSQERDTIYQLPNGSREFYFMRSGYDYDLIKQKVVTFDDREIIPIDEQELRKFVGKYQLDEGSNVFELFIENNQLHARQLWNNHVFNLVAESATRFLVPAKNATLDFVINKEGTVSKFRIHLTKEVFKRIKD